MASFKSIMVAVMMFVLVTVVAFGGYQIADASQDGAAAVDKTVTNETITQYYDTWQLVNKSTAEFTAGFAENVTVYNSTGAELTQTVDYAWNATDGAILFYDTASTNETQTATITYGYYENTNAVKDIAGPIGVAVNAIGQLPLMVAGLGFAVILFAVGAIVLKQVRGGPQTRR